MSLLQDEGVLSSGETIAGLPERFIGNVDHLAYSWLGYGAVEGLFPPYRQEQHAPRQANPVQIGEKSILRCLAKMREYGDGNDCIELVVLER